MHSVILIMMLALSIFLINAPSHPHLITSSPHTFSTPSHHPLTIHPHNTLSQDSTATSDHHLQLKLHVEAPHTTAQRYLTLYLPYHSPPLLKHPLNTTSQPTLSTHPLNPPPQHPLSTHPSPRDPLCHYPPLLATFPY